jgi:hypothetical protein
LPFFSPFEKSNFDGQLTGALGGNRTRDLSLTKGVLYH